MTVTNVAVGIGEYANELTVGLALARFLREVDTVESNIGDLRVSNNNGDDLRVSGLMITKNDRCDLLSDLDLSLDCTPKLNKASGKNPIYILNNYVKYFNCEDGEKLRLTLKYIESNKLLIAPIKPGDTIDIELKGKRYLTNVHSIKWINNKTTKKLEYRILTDNIPDADNKRVICNIEDYGTKLLLADVERLENMKNDKRKFIHMLKSGIIATIVVSDINNNAIIIDNQYMYHLESSRARIIGEWEGNKMHLEDSKLSNSKIFKYVDKNIEYISKHRRYIAPYSLSDYNIVSVK